MAGKLLATLTAVIPLVAGAIFIWQGATHHEPDPGPGNMPSFFPAALAGIVEGIVLIFWAIPQLWVVEFIWYDRRWAFLAAAVFDIAQGLCLGFSAVVAPRAAGMQWPIAILATESTVAGVLLFLARK